jgi:hypothetical protein
MGTLLYHVLVVGKVKLSLGGGEWRHSPIYPMPIDAHRIGKGYSTFLVRIPSDVISLQFFTLKVVGL